MHSLEMPQWGDSNEYTLHTCFRWYKTKIPFIICFLELLEIVPRDFKNEFESDTVYEPLMFESLKVYGRKVKTWDNPQM